MFCIVATKSLTNRAQTAPNEKVTVHEQVRVHSEKPYQRRYFDEFLITRGSIYGHFPHDGLA